VGHAIEVAERDLMRPAPESGPRFTPESSSSTAPSPQLAKTTAVAIPRHARLPNFERYMPGVLVADGDPEPGHVVQELNQAVPYSLPNGMQPQTTESLLSAFDDRDEETCSDGWVHGEP
jgi:hypothetical protein